MNMGPECRFRESPNWACPFGAYYDLEGLLFPIVNASVFETWRGIDASTESSGITTILDSFRALIPALISFNGLGHLMEDDLSQSCIAV
jgi:hypothetical protein